MPTSSRPRLRIGTRELVIAFAIVEAVVLLWLVTGTSRERRERRARRDGRERARADSITLAPRRP